MVTEDLWGAAKAVLERVPANPPGTEILTRRARTLRTRRYAVAGLALVVIAAGLFFPLRLLSRLGTQPEKDRFGPGSSGVSPIPGERPSVRPDWFAHVDTRDSLRIEAPRDWVYRKDVMTSDRERNVLFAMGPWNVPVHWQTELCGSDAVLRFLPDTGVLLWFEEIAPRALLLDPVEGSLRLHDLVPWRSTCVPGQQVERLGFRLDGRGFLVWVAFGQDSPKSLRTTVDQVLQTFRTRIEEEPFPPEPTGPVVEVANGTAFGRTWTLTAYWTKFMGDRVVCYSILGSGSGCTDPKAPAPKVGSYFQSINATSQRGSALPSETFVYGVVWKGVRGVTLALDDGRVLTSETLRSREFPVAFYVIPYEGSADFVSLEALDADGKVLDQHTPFAP